MLQQIEISQDLNKKSIYSPAHSDFANLSANTCTEELGDVESGERLVELQRPADRELWQSYLQLVHLEEGGFSIYVELFSIYALCPSGERGDLVNYCGVASSYLVEAGLDLRHHTRHCLGGETLDGLLFL